MGLDASKFLGRVAAEISAALVAAGIGPAPPIDTGDGRLWHVRVGFEPAVAKYVPRVAYCFSTSRPSAREVAAVSKEIAEGFVGAGLVRCGPLTLPAPEGRFDGLACSVAMRFESETLRDVLIVAVRGER